MSTEQSFIGRCFCGAVELSVSGEPAAMVIVTTRLAGALVGRSRQCLNAVKARYGQGDSGRRVRR